ncbi:MerR HTH family regulatory protein [Caloranaerobacter azorensis DSM 13643]|uniref:MerR HTH family regulatory protein n=1 Tax=Caloranaerobacter azorensis DSM 13643 TaxID=1121264 RepID=A0A1M5TA51_9FIRM|nr:MerR family transcriptional regulator [Caloranaerobacter azorensis]SHH47594.1 MerR HTH family regulatory protein [Caloranaerobacter azorensis DSM 13643]
MIEKKYSISEVSKITGYPQHILRFYEKEFKLNIPRTKSNRRYYTYKEIEKINYIKELQNKGFTNKQIKIILNSPEEVISDSYNESAITLATSQSNDISSVKNFIAEFQNNLLEIIQETLKQNNINNIEILKELKMEIEQLKHEIKNKEHDVLICENAKLKMKLKEKSYEVAELKEKLKREKEANKSIFKKIFKRK